MTLERLQKNADNFFEISNDKKAKALLVELGLTNIFTQTTALQTQIVASGKHPTHHIVALLFSGRKNKRHNGCLIYCIPRNRFSPDMIAQFLEEIALGQDVLCSIKLLPDNVSEN